MNKPKEVIRIFKTSDAEAVKVSRVFYNQFNRDKEKFILIDPDLGNSFSTNWDLAITAAEGNIDDSSVTSDISLATKTVREKMELGRNHFQTMKYYIEKAFPNNPTVWNSFGYAEYDSARNSETRFVPFLTKVHRQAVKYANELIAVNFTQANIDMIDTIRLAISNADQAQEDSIGNRPVLSQQRIVTLNTMWEFLLKVNKASKIVFADDYAKLQQYLKPDEPGYTPKEEEGNTTPPMPGN